MIKYLNTIKHFSVRMYTCEHQYPPGLVRACGIQKPASRASLCCSPRYSLRRGLSQKLEPSFGLHRLFRKPLESICPSHTHHARPLGLQVHTAVPGFSGCRGSHDAGGVLPPDCSPRFSPLIPFKVSVACSVDTPPTAAADSF